MLTVPGGKMASNRSVPNIPRLDRVKVPATQRTHEKESIFTAVVLYKLNAI